MRRQAGSNIPVIMMSARSDMVARMRALRAGADIYLTKPIDMGVLEERIEQFRPDAIVLDHNMPGCQGMELARVLRQA